MKDLYPFYSKLVTLSAVLTILFFLVIIFYPGGEATDKIRGKKALSTNSHREQTYTSRAKRMTERKLTKAREEKAKSIFQLISYDDTRKEDLIDLKDQIRKFLDDEGLDGLELLSQEFVTLYFDGKAAQAHVQLLGEVAAEIYMENPNDFNYADFLDRSVVEIDGAQVNNVGSYISDHLIGNSEGLATASRSLLDFPPTLANLDQTSKNVLSASFPFVDTFSMLDMIPERFENRSLYDLAIRAYMSRMYRKDPTLSELYLRKRSQRFRDRFYLHMGCQSALTHDFEGAMLWLRRIADKEDQEFLSDYIERSKAIARRKPDH